MFARFIFKTEFNDYLLGYLIAIVCLLIGAIFEQGLAFGMIFLGFNLVLSWCLIFYTLMSERTGSNSPPKEFKKAGKSESPGSALLSWTTGLPLPHYGLGIIHQRSGENSKAIEAFKQALSLDPKLEQAHYFLAEIYNEMGQEQKAVFHMRSAEKISGQKE